MIKHFKFDQLFIFTLLLTTWSVTPRVHAQELTPITSPNCNQFVFDASESSDPDNEKITYDWDFGDGNTAGGMVVNHTYQSSGEYFVNLTITDNSGIECSTDSITEHVLVNIPPFADFTAQSRVCVNDPIFMDASASYADSGQPLVYAWDFGDGTGQENVSQVTKVYTRGGSYEITLLVDDPANQVCSSAVAKRAIYVNEPPIVDVGSKDMFKCITTPDDLVVKFDASNTKDINNDTLKYTWDFGDGESGTGSVIQHQYDRSGIYSVKLIVDDNSELVCSSSVSFINLRLTQTPKAHAGDDVIGCVGEEIPFDGTQSVSETPGTLSAVWNFGDGQSSEGVVTSYAYPSPGQYQAILTVTDQLNPMCPSSSDIKNVVINATPTVAIKSQPLGCLGEEIQFDATSALDPDGDELEFYWTFGDGQILKGGPVVKHQYQQGGEYRVTVIVDDGQASSCSTATAETVVRINTPPQADAGPNMTCCAGVQAEFNATASIDADNDPLIYTWDFGDGNTQEGAVVNHAYAKSGSYNVVLTVDDNSRTQCSKSSVNFVAEVNAQPVATFKVR